MAIEEMEQGRQEAPRDEEHAQISLLVYRLLSYTLLEESLSYIAPPALQESPHRGKPKCHIILPITA